MLMRHVQRIDHFAVHVELTLPDRPVAKPHRLSIAKSRQPMRFPFDRVAVAVDAVKGLHIDGGPGDRAPEPGNPSLSLSVVTGMDKAEQRESRITQPTITVIPVSLAPRPLGQ